MTHSPHNVLILSDLPEATRALLAVLAERGTHATVARKPAEARRELDRDRWTLVITAAGPWDADGLSLVRDRLGHRPDLPVVVFGPGDAGAAVEAFRRGARDYLLTPIDAARAAGMLNELAPSHAVASAEGDGESGWRIAGQSKSLRDVVHLARQVATTTVPVLISGESGTGKELIAHLIHRHSRRSDRPYVRVNCAALSESLLESELFGHERGAFTGAVDRRVGRFERADGGTLLLDEISETSPRLQAELLRVLEQQELERVGGTEPIRINVRVICTSNRRIAREVEKGRFRRDLFYRICGVHLRVPALRERAGDIEPLVWHFVDQFAGEVGRSIETIDADMLAWLARHPWPGNVRELRNVVRGALVLGEGEVLRLHPTQRLTGQFTGRGLDGTLSLQELERQAIFEALRRTSSHQARAAELLGITDRTLREKLRRYRKEQADAAEGDRQWVMETV